MRGHDWEAIKDAYPIRDIVTQSGVTLHKKGKEWSGCCPLHQEKTASFYVNEEKQKFYCFGCGAGGDVISFVSMLKKIDIAQAVSDLTGGQTPRMTDEDRRAREEWLEQERLRQAEEQRQAIAIARSRWDRATRLDGANGYLTLKGIAPFGCRVEGENLLVEMYDGNGETCNVQSITPDGTKRFQKGAPTAGMRMHIGVPMGRAFICEGFATGATIYDALADQVIVAFSSGNIPAIARELVGKGVNVIIAADAKAETQMKALGEELDIPVVIAPYTVMPNREKPGDDFNDQMQVHGLDVVRASIAQGLHDWNNRPPPPPEPPFCSISFVDAADFDETKIERRKWIIPGALMAGSTHILAAPGGTGKSLFTLQLAITLATGMEWGKWTPRRRCKVMIINAEDDVPEQHRRVAAARAVMDVRQADIAGRIMVANNPTSIAVAEMDASRRLPKATALVEQLVAAIRHHAIDVLIVDPFAETFEGDENSNDEVKWAMKIWRDDIARATGCAVYLVHHVTKDSNDGSKAGSASAVRGASALVNSVRFAATMFNMSLDQATALGVEPKDRFRYVRYDDAKSNHSLISDTTWFEKVSVVLQNGDAGSSDGGDEVGALKPWEPSASLPVMYDRAEVFAALSAVNDMYVNEDGICTDQPFIRKKMARSKRWIGDLLMQHIDMDQAAAKALADALVQAGTLIEYDYFDEAKGADRKGLKANMDQVFALYGPSPQ